MRSGPAIVLLALAAVAVAGEAAAQDLRVRDHPFFRLPQQPDFSDTPLPDRRGEPERLRLQGADRGRPADRGRGADIGFGSDTPQDRLRDLGVRDGARFRDQGRLYVFAADGQTAVGYNLTHGDDGWSREGLSIDTGAFMGDAQAGIAWRQGDFQTSFGYVQRTIEREGRIGRDLDEDIVALHVSFVPGR